MKTTVTKTESKNKVTTRKKHELTIFDLSDVVAKHFNTEPHNVEYHIGPGGIKSVTIVSVEVENKTPGK